MAIAVVIVVAVVVAALMLRYIDLPFGTPKSARPRRTTRRSDQPVEGEIDSPE